MHNNTAQQPISPNDPAKLLAWATRLQHIADTADAALPTDPAAQLHWINTFQDEAGHRRAIDPIFLNPDVVRAAGLTYVGIGR